MRRFVFVALLSISAPGATRAQSGDEDRMRCTDHNPDIGIAGCTAIIGSGQETTKNLAVAFYNRGAAYDAKGDYDRAIQDYDQAIRLNPDDADAFNDRCFARATAGKQLEIALADCNQALRLQPGYEATLDSRGLVYLRLGRLEEAIKDYDAVIAKAPKAASSLYGRGIAQLRGANKRAGNADIVRAYALDPKIAATFKTYGVTP